MFDTLDMLRTCQGPEARLWCGEHSSHAGNVAATEMGACGEFYLLWPEVPDPRRKAPGLTARFVVGQTAA